MKKEHFILSAMLSIFTLIGLGIGLYFNANNDQAIEAAATDRNGEVILATGPVFIRLGSASENVNYSSLEAVYTLDQGTGQLTAGVLAREGRGFQGLFSGNVNDGLASVMAAAGDRMAFPQRPRYTMVTGEVTIPNQAGAKWQVPQAVVYIHEQTTGYLMVYTITWDQASYNKGGSQQGPMELWTAYRFTPEHGN